MGYVNHLISNIVIMLPYITNISLYLILQVQSIFEYSNNSVIYGDIIAIFNITGSAHHLILNIMYRPGFKHHFLPNFF